MSVTVTLPIEEYESLLATQKAFTTKQSIIRYVYFPSKSYEFISNDELIKKLTIDLEKNHSDTEKGLNHEISELKKINLELRKKVENKKKWIFV